MSDLSEKLWPSFQAEVSEQLEAIELALLSNDQADLDVNSLFRHFHTIKGGCAMMGFLGMEQVAHAAEDLLDPVRKNRVTLDSPRIEILLQALDGLKTQMDYAGEHRQAPPANPALVDALSQFVGQADPSAAAGKPVTEESAAVADEPAPAVPDASAIADFASACQAFLPLLMLSEEYSRQSEDQVTMLSLAADQAGLSAISETLSCFKAQDAASWRTARAELMNRLAFLEQRTDCNCAVSEAAQLLRMQHQHNLAAASRELVDCIGEITSVASADKTLFRNAISASTRLLQETWLQQLPYSSALVRTARQTLREIQRHQVTLELNLADQLIQAVALVQQLQGSEEGERYSEVAVELCAQLQKQCALIDGLRNSRLLSESILASIEIPAPLLKALPEKSLQRLQASISDQQTIACIVADLESQPDAGEAFLAWLDRHGILVGSETTFDNELDVRSSVSTRIRFLMGTSLSAQELQNHLDELDPENHFYELTVFASRQDSVPHSADSRDETTAPIAERSNRKSSTTLRVDSRNLDQFVNRVGELVMLRNQFSHQIGGDELQERQRRLKTLLGQRSGDRPLSDTELQEVRRLLADLEKRDEQLSNTDLRIQNALERMQEDALELRVVPISMVFNRLPRVVRDVSQNLGKQVTLHMSGEDVRIDKSLIDVLLEPLMHLVRNAIDHGIETPDQREKSGKPGAANLTLAARQQGNTLLVDVQDDGRGLDMQRIRQRARSNELVSAEQLDKMDERSLTNLIFMPGFSTSETITEVSGRGVGMDVVKTRVTQVGGQIEVHSAPGKGCRFTLKLPLSAAIQNVVLVGTGNQRIAIPERNVTEVINLPRKKLQSIQGQACVILRDRTLPVYRLDALLGHIPKGQESGRDNLEIVVLSDGTWCIGLLVDQVLGRPEIFVRDVHPDIVSVSGVGGVSVLGDGSLVIIADCENLFELALANAQSLHSLGRLA